MSLLATLAALSAHAEGPAPGLVPLAYPPGTTAGNEARFAALALHVTFVPGAEDARPLEVATCPERKGTVPVAAALKALERGFAAAGLELRVDGKTAGLAALGPAPEKAPFLLVLPGVPAPEVVKALGATVEPVDAAFVVSSTADRRGELERALCAGVP